MTRAFPIDGVGKAYAQPNRLPIFARLPLGCRFCLEEMTYKLGIKLESGWMLSWDLAPCNNHSCSLEESYGIEYAS